MHRALYLEEILPAIFGYCYPEPSFGFPQKQGYSAFDLVALATTCRIFKEPALDVLWVELKDTTPLARCLPGVSALKGPESGDPIYSFKRQLKAAERETVQKYARRVRHLSIYSPCLDRESLADLCMSSKMDPLFHNIRRLHFIITDSTLPFVHHVLSPKLKWLHLHLSVSNISPCQSFIHLLGPRCPHLNQIQISSTCTSPSLDQTICRHFCYWTHLQRVDCATLSFDIDAFVHLSHAPDLTMLSFTLSPELTDKISSSSHLFVFPALRGLWINSEPNAPISELFTHMRLPAIASICILFSMSPSRHTIRSSLIALRAACTRRRTIRLSVFQTSVFGVQGWGHSVLTLNDIRYFTAFNLAHLRIDLNWGADLKDHDLIEIASLCPQLQSLCINESYGWRASGITPAGLAQFLQRCSLLYKLSIALDTRDYVYIPQAQTSFGNTLPKVHIVDVTDSVIEVESVPALAAFFADIFPELAHKPFWFHSWEHSVMQQDQPNHMVYKERWQDVYVLAKQKLLERRRRPTRVPESC